jgi:hypothetical protein
MIAIAITRAIFDPYSLPKVVLSIARAIERGNDQGFELGRVGQAMMPAIIKLGTDQTRCFWMKPKTFHMLRFY